MNAPSEPHLLDPADASAEALVAQLGREVAQTLSTALERVVVLAKTGHIDRAGLRALRDEIDHARRLGMAGQQLGRLAAGIALADEALDLHSLLRQAAAQRRREADFRGIEFRVAAGAAIVVTDPSLLFSLLVALLDWALEHARGDVELAVERDGWPQRTRLAMRFAHLPADLAAESAGGGDEPLPASLTWRLAEETARALALPVARRHAGGRTELTLEFPHAVAHPSQTEATIALAGPGGGAVLAGAQVLVVASRRETRSDVRTALAGREVLLDFVTSVDEARRFCAARPPQALVHEAALGGENLERLRLELRRLAPRIAFVQISEGDRAFERRDGGSDAVVAVGRGAVVASLAEALAFAMMRPA